MPADVASAAGAVPGGRAKPGLPSAPMVEAPRVLSIAIVGCGPSGMAAALLLSRLGHRVRIFERFVAPRPVGAGLLLQPTGLAVLSRLGLAESIAAAGARIDRLDGRAVPSGRKILDVAYADLGPGIHGVAIHRASLFDALYDAVSRAGIDITPGTTIAAIEPGADRRPVLRDGLGRTHGGFDLLVDASGAQSALRAGLSAAPPRPFAYGALWTTLPLAGHAFDPAVLAQRYVAARHMIGVMPLGTAPGATGPHAAFFWSIRRDRVEAWKKAGLAAWRDEVRAIWPEAALLIAGIDDPALLQPAFYAHFTARMPVGPRFALIGDAAHSTSPQLGQGANMGLLAALALSEAIERHASLEAALPAYAAARRRNVRFYQAASDWLTPLFQSDSLAAARLRDLGLPALARFGYFRRETIRALAGLKTGLFSTDGSALATVKAAGPASPATPLQESRRTP